MNHILDDFNFENYVVIGVSAGPDSMCLLDLLRRKTDKLIVCHINHNVRRESIDEEKFLKDYCQKNNLILETTTIKEYKENNFENEARKKRYSFYEETLKKYHSKYLLLAHHGDDLIETILMKIVRGSNIEGYAGIKEVSKSKNYYIIRPLLPYTKEDIIEYNKKHNIPYFIDNSNKNTEYTRNRYRKRVLPLLKEEDKKVHLKFLKYSQILQEYDNYIKNITMKETKKIYQNNVLNLDKFSLMEDFLQKNILYYILNSIYENTPNTITEKHIDNILKIIKSYKPNLKLNLPNNKLVIKEYHKLYIVNNKENNDKYKIEFNDNLKIDNFTFKIVNNENNDGNNICRLNSKEINFPIYFRSRKESDKIILKGSNYTKKIKEIFIENKLPIIKRKDYPLLVDSQDNILWIPNIKKSKFCMKNNENYDIIIKCIERKENYE